MVDGVIVLYEQNETAFASNGIGYLPDATECTVTEELNGEFELEMEYPINGVRYSEIKHRRILYVKTNPYEEPQPFRIYKINKPIDGRVGVNARHISYDLSGYPLPAYNIATLGGSGNSGIPFCTGPKGMIEKLPEYINRMNSDNTPFTFWTNSVEDYPSLNGQYTDAKDKESKWVFIDSPTSTRALIGELTSKYKGEFKFDFFTAMILALSEIVASSEISDNTILLA